MVKLRFSYEMSIQYQAYESLQLVVSQVFGGSIEDEHYDPLPSVRGTEVTNMDQLMNAVQTIGGRIGG